MWNWLFVFFVLAIWVRVSESTTENEDVKTGQSSDCPKLQFINKEMPNGGSKTVTCPLGATVILSCQINGTNEFHWTDPTGVDHEDRQSLTLQNLTTDKSLTYKCDSVSISSCSNSVHFSFVLAVKDPSEFIIEAPKNITGAVVGQKVVFNCTTPSTANVTWYNPENKTIEAPVKGRLEINNVGSEHAGWYSCVAQYSSECSRTEKAYLQVQTAEDFCKAKMDDKSHTTCEAAGKEFGVCEEYDEECDGECQCDGKGILS